jgi:hypothetical protein
MIKVKVKIKVKIKSDKIGSSPTNHEIPPETTANMDLVPDSSAEPGADARPGLGTAGADT